MARDQKLAGMLTGATPYCRPWPGRTYPALRWSVLAVKPNGRGGYSGSRSDWTSDEKTLKWMSKNIIFEVMSEVQKDFRRKR